jgi:hypothetical protein
MFDTLHWKSAPFKRRGKMEQHFDGGDSGTKKCKRRLWCGLRLVGVWSKAVCFVFVSGESGFSYRKYAFTFNLL